MIRYNRRPSEAFKKLFIEGGFLHGLTNTLGFRAEYRNIPFNAFFREGTNRKGGNQEGDEISIYCGKTSVAAIRYLKGKIRVEVGAEKSYQKDQKAIADPLMAREWDPAGNRREDFFLALKNYLSAVKVDSSWWDKEGLVQAFRSRRHGMSWRKGMPWAIFDCEAKLGYSNTSERQEVLLKIAPRREAVRNAVGEMARRLQWDQIQEQSSNKLDMIGVSADGKALVLVETKHCTGEGWYYAGLQLLDYILEWQNALRSPTSKEIVNDINGLITDQKELGLLPPEAPQLDANPVLKPILVNGPVRHSPEIKARFQEVIKIINRVAPGQLDDLDVEEGLI